MVRYTSQGNRHSAVIDGKLVDFDSNLEEKVARILSEKGYAGRWRRMPMGLHDWGNNYTPDFEIAVDYEGKTYRLLLEVKPTIEHINSYIIRRMIGASNAYFTDMLFLYTDDDGVWRRINKKDGSMTVTDLPPPSKKRIDELYTPLMKEGKRVYYHRYKQRIRWETLPLHILVRSLETGVAALTIVFKKPRRLRRGHRHKH